MINIKAAINIKLAAEIHFAGSFRDIERGDQEFHCFFAHF